MSITTDQLDTLKELMNIGVGQAACVLNEMLNSHVELQVPCIRIVEVGEIGTEIERYHGDRFSCVRLNFSGSFVGCASLIFPPESAARLVGIVIGDEPESYDLDSVRIGALNEVGNIIINGIMGSMGNLLQTPIDYAIPFYIEGDFESLVRPTQLNSGVTLLVAETRFKIQQYLIEGDILLLFEVESFKNLTSAIDRINEEHGVLS